MALWHTTVLATSLAATAAIGLASAAIYSNGRDDIALKADRLPVIADASGTVTIETRADGLSVLQRVPVD